MQYSIRKGSVLFGTLIAIGLLIPGCVSTRTALQRPSLNAAEPGITTAEQPDRARLIKIVDSYIGTCYLDGGMSRQGVDCSGFVWLVYKELYGVTLPRSSTELFNIGDSLSLSEARPGDLVFFRKDLSHTVNHVGIFMGDSMFVHTSSACGVRYNSLSETYYKKRFAGIRRYQ